MSATVNIKRGDLHLAVSAAFTRGRYVLMTGGDGRLLEITIDLKERDDDLFDAEGGIDASGSFWRFKSDVATYDHVHRHVPLDETNGMVQSPGGYWGFPSGTNHSPPATDDHGPAIPAQTSRIETPFGAVEGVVTNADGSPGPVVYEFALQDINASRREAGLVSITLDQIELSEVNGERAAAADWVHVYDRVTRERRTLKRPAPDAILTGLQDVAADLRAR
jgi:hypothetical protein